jgi:hydrogenase expression/formation protein HypD
VRGLGNFSVLCNHVLTPSAITHILAVGRGARMYGTVPLDGFIGPAHVSIVIGSRPTSPLPAHYRKPVVIAGFEPLDVMQAILMLVRQVNDGRAEVENQFTRAVTREGNRAGAGAHGRGVRDARVASNGAAWARCRRARLKIRPAFAAFDAEQRFALRYHAGARPQAVRLRRHPARREAPTDCKLFGTVCTPENPMGSCMVSSEGACAAHYTYGRFRDIAVVAAMKRDVLAVTCAARSSSAAASS